MNMADFANDLLGRIASAQREPEPEPGSPPAWIKNFREAREHDEPFDDDGRNDSGDEVLR